MYRAVCISGIGLHTTLCRSAMLTNLNTVVSVCTTCLALNCSLRTQYVMCFVWISEQTAIISLYSINRLVFIAETECVYCAVRTGSLAII
jgi:hypothetical protein